VADGFRAARHSDAKLNGRQPTSAAGLQYAQVSKAEPHLLDRVNTVAAIAYRDEAAVEEGREAWKAACHQCVDEAQHR
jgi:hypothetical protein